MSLFANNVYVVKNISKYFKKIVYLAQALNWDSNQHVENSYIMNSN